MSKFRNIALGTAIAAAGVLVSPGSSWASTKPYEGLKLRSSQRVVFVHNSNMRIQSHVDWRDISARTGKLYNPGETSTSAVLQKHTRHGWLFHWYTWDNVGRATSTGWTRGTYGTLRNKLYCQHGTFRVHVSWGGSVVVGRSPVQVVYILHREVNSKPVTIRSCR